MIDDGESRTPTGVDELSELIRRYVPVKDGVARWEDDRGIRYVDCIKNGKIHMKFWRRETVAISRQL